MSNVSNDDNNDNNNNDNNCLPLFVWRSFKQQRKQARVSTLRKYMPDTHNKDMLLMADKNSKENPYWVLCNLLLYDIVNSEIVAILPNNTDTIKCNHPTETTDLAYIMWPTAA
jgi:hypothetical protein